MDDDRPPTSARCAGRAETVAAEWGSSSASRSRIVASSSRPPATTPCSRCAGGDYDVDARGRGLELWDGDGAVRLLRRDAARRALLEERARPGRRLAALPEDEATAIAVAVGSALWRARALAAPAGRRP